MSGKSLAKTPRNDVGSSSNKRMKEMSIDRLSALPDSLLIHILSFLGVKQSAVTSVLSKRWEFIWTELPDLRFSEDSKDMEKRREFVEMVNRTLLIRTGIHLEKFDVHFKYNDSFASDIDSWVDFVSKHTVKEFGLRLYRVGSCFSPSDFAEEFVLYSLPETMFSNSSLKRFSMGQCRLDTLTNIEWKSLIWLHINFSELTQHVVENILSGCPLLHTLELKECWGFSCLEVKSRNLHELKISECDYYEEDIPLLEISAPYVHTLDITCSLDQRKLVLRNTEYVVRAKIDFTGYWDPEHEEEVESLTKELYAIVLQLEEVELGRKYFEVLSRSVADGWQLPVSRRKCLTIHTSSGDEHNISGIFALLKFSPNLEKLAIEGVEPRQGTWYGAKGDLDCDLLHLKTVRISEFANPAFGGEPMITVARTLLERATVLEEMKVTLRVEDIDDYVEIGQTLFTYPRSSEKATIEFHELVWQLWCQR